MTVEGWVTGEAILAKIPGECFSLFFNEEMVAEIVRLTNLNIQRYIDRMSPEKQHQYNTDSRYGPWLFWTNAREIRAFFGLFLVRGLMKVNFWMEETKGKKHHHGQLVHLHPIV